jgi:hypothetical protein
LSRNAQATVPCHADTFAAQGQQIKKNGVNRPLHWDEPVTDEKFSFIICRLLHDDYNERRMTGL